MRSAQRTAAACAAAVVCACGAASGQYVKLLPADGGHSDHFGTSLGLDGATLVVGASWDTPLGTDSGSAYVFERVAGQWEELVKLIPSAGQAWERFGESVAVRGDFAVIGSPRSEQDTASGKAYVFERLRAGWTEVAVLEPGDGQPADWFGCTVAIDGTRLVVGSVLDDTELGVDSGSAYVYELIDGSWTQTAKLTASDGITLHAFGQSVAMEGDLAVVGAPHSSRQGVYIFELIGGVWTETGKLALPPGPDDFGWSVAISGERLIVGDPFDDTIALNAGAAYIFERAGGQWVLANKLLAPDGAEGDRFGWSVGIMGDAAVVGATWTDTPIGPSRGSAYEYQRGDDGVWAQRARVFAPDGAFTGEFGYSVGVGAGEFAVGGPGDDDNGRNAGAVYMVPLDSDRSADFNGDGVIDTRDVLDFLEAWSQHDLAADWDSNWWVDTRDVLAFLNDWVSG